MALSRNAPLIDPAIVDASLSKLGLGELLPGSVKAHPGRHSKCSGSTVDGYGVFVKRTTAPGVVRARTAEGLDPRKVRRPTLLGAVEEENILVYEFVESSDAGDVLAREGRFGPELARRVGEILGSLHRASIPRDGDLLSPETLPFPPAEQLEALPLPEFAAASGATLELWRLMQRAGELGEAARGLRHRESRVAGAPAHCDIRLDQFLVLDGTPYLADWEEFRIADPARDLGAFVGEWLYDAMVTAYRTEPGESRPVADARYVAARLRTVQPLVAGLWLGYRSSVSPDDADLPRRAVSYAGWHLLDRLLVHSAGMAQVRPIHRAVFGLARSALLSPDAIARLIELEPADANRAHLSV